MTDQIESHILLRYSLTQKVGKGAYGVVWKAAERQSGKTVAVKKVFDAFNNVTDAQRTYREVAFLKQLKHPNIVLLHTTYPAVNEKDLYMIFEYMETDLHVAIRADVLEQLHRRYIVYQILKALKYMHTAGVIHRDLKPANVLLDSQCTAKLADFGLARSVGYDDENDSVLTEYVATRWFRSPEILIGSRTYGYGVDMWSLGCIMGEMLLGKALFPGQSTLNQLQKITEALGSPTKQDIASLLTPYANELFSNLPVVHKPRLRTYFRDAEQDELDLIERLLVYDPSKRITVDEALTHPYVAQFRSKPDEIGFTGQIALELDDNQHYDIGKYRDYLYGKPKPKIAPKMYKKDAAKINELVSKQKSSVSGKRQSSHEKKSDNFLRSPKNSAIFRPSAKQEKTIIIDQLDISPHKKKDSNYFPQQTNSVKNLLSQKAVSPSQKLQTSPGASPTQKQAFNYVDYLKQYQQMRKQVTQARQSKGNISKRPPSGKKEESTLAKSKDKSTISRQNSPTIKDLKKNSFVHVSAHKNSIVSNSKNLQRVKSPVESRPWTSTVYQRGTYKSTGIQSFYQKPASPTLYRSALNHTTGNRILSNLTNNSVLGESSSSKPSKSQQYLNKLLKQM